MKKREANRVVLLFFEEKRRRSKYLNIASWMGLTSIMIQHFVRTGNGESSRGRTENYVYFIINRYFKTKRTVNNMIKYQKSVAWSCVFVLTSTSL